MLKGWPRAVVGERRVSEDDHAAVVEGCRKSLVDEEAEDGEAMVAKDDPPKRDICLATILKVARYSRALGRSQVEAATPCYAL